MAYRIEYYPPDGHEIPRDQYPRLHDTFWDNASDAKEAIIAAVGHRGTWITEEGYVAYHESDDVGCGGFVICREEY